MGAPLEDYSAMGQDVPWKMLGRPEAWSGVSIKPYHVILSPTNKCNGNCTWCSCGKVDRGLEWDWADLTTSMEMFKDLGCRAVTITGGGEPTLYGRLSGLLQLLRDLGIRVGLITNGLIDPPRYSTVDWTRFSVIDSMTVSRAERLMQLTSDRSVGFSYTVTSDVDVNKALAIAVLAEKYTHVTHVRFVQDILASHNPLGMYAVQEKLRDSLQQCPKSFLQRQDNYSKGIKRCWVSLLRPVLGADGWVYPCCGVQYALENSLCMSEKFRMCRWSAAREFWDQGIPYSGEKCSKCYYRAQSVFLEDLRTNTRTNPDFV